MITLDLLFDPEARMWWILYLPYVVPEMVFFILGGITLCISAVKAGKGWILRTLFFVLGVVLECGMARFLTPLIPFGVHFLDKWLLGLIVSLTLVGIISFTLFRMMEWIDSARYDRDKKYKNGSTHARIKDKEPFSYKELERLDKEYPH
jgi:hypothetical protein